MNNPSPIIIRPLTMRGTFGIAWQLLKRRLGSIVGYVLIFNLIVALMYAIACAPLLPVILYEQDAGTGAAIAGILLFFLLIVIAGAANVLLITPVFTGTLYAEMSARIYADGSSFASLMKRGKFSLKRYFTTTMSLIVAGIVIGVARSILSGILSGMLSIFGVVFSIPAALASFDLIDGGFMGAASAIAGMSGWLVLLFFILFTVQYGIQLLGQSFIYFTYPVAANENVFHFNAIGRSIKLAFARYGRIIGCKALFALIMLGCGIPALILVVLSIAFAQNAAVCLICALLAFIYVIALSVFSSMYVPALDTVLYYDARVRAEGSAWMGIDDPAPAQEQQPAWQPEQPPVHQPEDAPMQYEPAAVINNNNNNNNNNANENDGGEHGA